MKTLEIDHICFAVRSLHQAREVYEGVLGMEPAKEYESEEESVKVIRYYVGGVAVELIEPTNRTCEVARFLADKGEGFFLISYRVDDVEEALGELKARGYDTIDRKPRNLLGNRYAFIQAPKETHGVLTEILDGRFIDANVPPGF